MNTVDIVLLVDRSGSMSTDDRCGMAVQSINSFLEQQRHLQITDQTVYVTFVRFDDDIETVYERVLLQEISNIQREDIHPRGWTAYYDVFFQRKNGCVLHNALGMTIQRFKENPDVTNVIMCVVTDGLENKSVEYRDSKLVKKLLAEQRENAGWQFLFLASDESAIQDAVTQLGIAQDFAISYTNTQRGYEHMAKSLEHAVTTYRTM